MENTSRARDAHVPEATNEWVNAAEGWVSRRIFVDSDIYELEVERIFNRSWLLLGLEGEIPRPGDYLTRPMGDDLVIIVRGEDGVIRAFLN
ncbi:MAG: aromatic ring-hydroxylating dioxygenase subunit alpha, partial [Candidatus Binatia bacterium]